MRELELPDLSDLVPHRGDSLLLHRVIDHNEQETAAEADTSRQTWLKHDDGSIASWVALEYMAQCIAVHEGICARIAGRPPVRGLLSGAVGLRLYCSRFEPETTIRVRARRVRGRPGLGVISHFCTIHGEGTTSEDGLLAAGRLSISVPRPTRPEESATTG